MSNWFRQGLINFGNMLFLCFVASAVWIMIRLACESVGILPVWGYAAFLLATMFYFAMAAAKVDHDVKKHLKKGE